MGGRGSSGDNPIKKSIRIKNKMIEKGLNSKLKGVQRQAREGTGNYSYKDAKAISGTQAKKMTVYKVHESAEGILFEGTLGDKKVFYASDNSDPTVKALKAKMEASKRAQIADTKEQERPEVRTTSTYDRWKKRHDANFRAWFGNV